MSSQKLSIAVTFLMDHYHGGEWPPSPARLYQALVGGVMTCGYQRYAAEVEPALRWLERQSPPRIRACEALDRREFQISVPNNDLDVAAKKWAKNAEYNAAELRTMKAMRPKHLEPESPHIEYTWQVDSNEAAGMVAPLRTAAQCLHTLGWGIDVAFADVAEQPNTGTVYQPALSGELHTVPMPGTFDDLRAAYARFAARAGSKGVDTHTRPSMLRVQAYRRADDIYRPVAKFALMNPDPHLGRVKAVRWEHSMKVAGWLRHGACESVKNEYENAFVEQYVQGHGDEVDQRLSYLPVPSIYGRFSDGLIRRVLIVEPPNAPGDMTQILMLKLSGAVLTDRQEKDVCSLAPPEAADYTFSLYLPKNDRKVWRSVTPVVLHGHNTARHGVISVSKTERLLLRAFEMAGYADSMIEDLVFQAGPWWSGTGHASAIAVPKHLDGYPRLHVQVRFRRGTRGPVIAGIGRHYGIGLFASSGD